MIHLQRLEGFYWVAKLEGYARAARAFPYPITQPGIHQQVRRLEEEVGTALFERVSKDRVRLTMAGRTLYGFVAPFYEELPQVVRSMAGASLRGTLRFHAAGLALRQLLPPWIRRLQARRPEIQVSLTEMKVVDVGLLRSGEADLLVDYLPEPPSDVETLELADVHAFLALPSDHPQARRKRASLEHLADTPFIAYNADRHLRELQLQLLRRVGVTPARIHAADSADTILGFVAAGLGFSVVPSLTPSGPHVAGVFAQPVEVPGRRFRIVAAWRKRKRRDPLVDAALALAPQPSAPR